MTATFILNPAAGHGSAEAKWHSLEDRILEALPGAVCRRTEAPGHASDLAEQAARAGARRVIAVGGDGTLCEVLQGLMRLEPAERDEVALGCLPAGSGCDLARHLGYPSEEEALLRILSGSNKRKLDVGVARLAGPGGAEAVRHFINIAGFGLAGDVAERVARWGKPLGGTLTYLAATIAEVASARARHFRLIADGQDLSGRYHLVALANTAYTGGGMHIAPGATDDDGQFDLVLVGDRSRPALLGNLPKVYGGTHLEVEGVSLRRISRLEASCEGRAPVNLDGEASGTMPGTFAILPKAVVVLAP